MTNQVFDSAAESLLRADIDLLVDDIRTILIDAADYTVNISTHDFLDDVAAGARVATSGALTSKTVGTVSRAFDAADETWSAVSGDVSEETLFYVHSGVETTSDLILHCDTFSAGMPVTPNGGDIVYSFAAGGILAL